MADRNALAALIGAVEANTVNWYGWEDREAVLPNGLWEVARAADMGDLNAAKALHDALLPGWVARPQIGGAGAGVKVWHCTVEDWETGEEIEANNMPDPARAWLLALLRALESLSES